MCLSDKGGEGEEGMEKRGREEKGRTGVLCHSLGVEVILETELCDYNYHESYNQWL